MAIHLHRPRRIIPNWDGSIYHLAQCRCEQVAVLTRLTHHVDPDNFEEGVVEGVYTLTWEVTAPWAEPTEEQQEALDFIL